MVPPSARPARVRPRLELFWPQAAPVDAERVSALGGARTDTGKGALTGQ